ncbi:MAG: molecular chaperone TorD family protein [Deltaproteobacteria bacterium]|nr:molecular chaperone TorD family protein [Deltaproteobacteria bacterium]
MSDATTRGNCFKLLAACFYEPDRDLFIEEQVCPNLQSLLNGWAAGASKAANNMNLGLKAANQDNLSVDHASLFVGPFELIAPPYGSVYLEKQRQVMGDSTMEVLQHYQQAGLSVDVKDAPDHIAIELEFMHFLCMKEAESSASGKEQEAEKFRELQRDFYLNALQWVPQFCSVIRKGSTSSFYKELANCLERFMVTCRHIYDKESEQI